MGRGESVAIKVVGVWKRYSGRWVLRNINLRVEQGDKLVVVGPNGSGKSTLIKILMGLTRPDKGVVRVFGEDVREAGFDRMRHNIGFMPEKTTLPGSMTVEDYLAMFSELRGCDYSDVAEALGLNVFYRAKINTLSQGYKRRLMLAASLLCKPQLVVLDEPYANIDVGSRFAIDEFLQVYAKNLTLLMTTHIKPGLSRFRSVLIIGGIIVGDLVYEDDYVEILLKCRNEYKVLRISATSKNNYSELVKLNKMLQRQCVVEDLDIVTFDKLLYNLLKHSQQHNTD